jgi:hypothetical protein
VRMKTRRRRKSKHQSDCAHWGKYIEPERLRALGEVAASAGGLPHLLYHVRSVPWFILVICLTLASLDLRDVKAGAGCVPATAARPPDFGAAAVKPGPSKCTACATP